MHGLDDVTPNGDNDYSVVKYEYDFYGNLVAYTNGEDESETYAYDIFNRPYNEAYYKNNLYV